MTIVGQFRQVGLNKESRFCLGMRTIILIKKLPEVNLQEYMFNFFVFRIFKNKN